MTSPLKPRKRLLLSIAHRISDDPTPPPRDPPSELLTMGLHNPLPSGMACKLSPSGSSAAANLDLDVKLVHAPMCPPPGPTRC
ncbi:hypothetical protein IMZ48_22465 [Candidatus Bathyarchaeota archaeon]|nr:hypothetical protein [Candidatus Bathyarchaeota archaeon]